MGMGPAPFASPPLLQFSMWPLLSPLFSDFWFLLLSFSGPAFSPAQCLHRHLALTEHTLQSPLLLCFHFVLMPGLYCRGPFPTLFLTDFLRLLPCLSHGVQYSHSALGFSFSSLNSNLYYVFGYLFNVVILHWISSFVMAELSVFSLYSLAASTGLSSWQVIIDLCWIHGWRPAWMVDGWMCGWMADGSFWLISGMQSGDMFTTVDELDYQLHLLAVWLWANALS